MKVFQKDATSKTIYLFIRDSGSTPAGQGKTGLVFNTAGLNISYQRNRAARVSITLVTQTVTGAFSSGGFVEVDSTNQPGLYRLDIPNAAIATGVDDVRITIKGTGVVDDYYHIDLVDFDPVTAPDSTATIADAVLDELLAGHVTAGSLAERIGRIPNVAAGANGGLPTVDASNAVKVQSGTGANQINLSNGLVTLAPVVHTGAVIPTVTAVTNGVTVTTNNDKTGYTVSTVSDKTGYALSATGLDLVLDSANGVETGLSLRGYFRLSGAASFGRSSGLGTATAVFNNAVANTKARITATVDADGNRGATTWDQT